MEGKGGSVKAAENGEEKDSHTTSENSISPTKTHLTKHNKEVIFSFDCQNWLLQAVQHTLERMERRTTIPNSDTGTMQGWIQRLKKWGEGIKWRLGLPSIDPPRLWYHMYYHRSKPVVGSVAVTCAKHAALARHW